MINADLYDELTSIQKRGLNLTNGLNIEINLTSKIIHIYELCLSSEQLIISTIKNCKGSLTKNYTYTTTFATQLLKY